MLHPLPRVDEISTDFDADPRARYFEQARAAPSSLYLAPPCLSRYRTRPCTCLTRVRYFEQARPFSRTLTHPLTHPLLHTPYTPLTHPYTPLTHPFAPASPVGRATSSRWRTACSCGWPCSHSCSAPTSANSEASEAPDTGTTTPYSGAVDCWPSRSLPLRLPRSGAHYCAVRVAVVCGATASRACAWACGKALNSPV